jgi:hypothetical protein
MARWPGRQLATLRLFLHLIFLSEWISHLLTPAVTSPKRAKAVSEVRFM